MGALAGLCVGLAVWAVVLAFGGSPAQRRWPRRPRRSRRLEWAEAAEQLAGALRGGVPLHEALEDLAAHGPWSLRPAFAGLAQDIEDTGRMGQALDRFAAGAHDRAASELAETLRVCHDLGGGDLAAALADLVRRARLRRGRILNLATVSAMPWLLVVALFLGARR